MQEFFSSIMVFIMLVISSLTLVYFKPFKGKDVVSGECLVQLVTESSKFDGEWNWQAAGMSYIIRTSKNRLIVH